MCNVLSVITVSMLMIRFILDYMKARRASVRVVIVVYAERL